VTGRLQQGREGKTTGRWYRRNWTLVLAIP
jgi:hypothetical protein